jgi:hypothetical protein
VVMLQRQMARDAGTLHSVVDMTKERLESRLHDNGRARRRGRGDGLSP